MANVLDREEVVLKLHHEGANLRELRVHGCARVYDAQRVARLFQRHREPERRIGNRLGALIELLFLLLSIFLQLINLLLWK